MKRRDSCSQRQFDIARLIRSEYPAAGILQQRDGLHRGMPEAIAPAHADDSDLRTQDRENTCSDCTTAAVVPDLEHVDVRQRPARRQTFQNLAFGISGQQHSPPAILDQQHDARGVLRRIVDRTQRPEHAHVDTPDPEYLTGQHAPLSSARLIGLSIERSELISGRDHEATCTKGTGQGTGTSGVVVVRMRKHDRIQLPDACTRECLAQR
jgi:hypothetical protein